MYLTHNLNDEESRLLDQELFHFLSPADRELLLKSAKKIVLKKNQTLTREGEPAHSFYVILSGKLRITKHAKNKKFQHLLAYLNAGDTVGEMALIENVPRGVTLKAVQPSILLEFDIATIKNHPALYHQLGLYLGKRTARRLRYLTEITVKSMEKELQAAKKHRAFGLLMITVLTIISAYMLSLRFLENIKLVLPITTIISAPMVVIIVAIMILVMKKSGFPWKTFGFRFKNWRHDSIEALLFSLPVIIILMAAKWVVIHWVLKNPALPLFNPQSSMPFTHTFNLPLYWASLAAYILLAPLQELIARGALQSGFYVFLPGSPHKRLWTAIIVSNLIFSLPHLYHSVYFALLVLIPGIFWGWLYGRQKSLVGVSLSHIFIGVWMVFIVGFEQLLMQLNGDMAWKLFN